MSADALAIANPRVLQSLQHELRGFPMCDGIDADRARGFVLLSRFLASVPVTTIGVLATVAAISVGQLALGSTALVFTVLLVLALWHDTRLAKALHRLRLGEVEAARAALIGVVQGTARPLHQRQRANAYLAAIGWMRNDHAEALRWTEARLASMQVGRPAADDLFFTVATRARLLALVGRTDEARAGLGQMGAAPPSDHCRSFEYGTRLLVAFVSQDVEPVRAHLEDWASVLQRRDDVGFGSALLVWAFDAAGQPQSADMLAQQLRESGVVDREVLAAHVPSALEWLDTRDQQRRYG